jgi:hypothetical protein
MEPQPSLNRHLMSVKGVSTGPARSTPAELAGGLDLCELYQFMVWHVARVEDRWLHRFAQIPRRSGNDGWYQRCGLPEHDTVGLRSAGS